MTPLGQIIMAVMWTQTLIALLFVVLRIYTRIRIMRNLGWDDHLATLSVALFFGYTIMCTVAAINGMGSRSQQLGVKQAVKAVKWEMMGQAFNILAIATSKSSVAVFLLRVVISRIHTCFLWGCIVTTTFVCLSCIVFMFTQCTPLESNFNPTIPHKCYINWATNAIFSGSYTAAMDFALAVFPWFILWQLNIKRKERIVILCGLSLGIFAGICGIIRAIMLKRLSGKADYTYRTVPVILWSSSELLICILCATIPALRPLYKRVRGINSTSPCQQGDEESHSRQGHRGLSAKSTTMESCMFPSVVDVTPDRESFNCSSVASYTRAAMLSDVVGSQAVRVTHPEKEGIKLMK